MRILSLSSVFPNPAEPGLGLFVHSRLEQLATFADVKVIAPVPVFDYTAKWLSLLRRRDFVRHRVAGKLEVFHPGWAYPPGGTPVNVPCQFARLLPVAASIRRCFPFDLIDSHFCYPEGVTAALLGAFFHVPFTITLRGSETRFAEYRSRRRLMEFAMRRAAAVIAVSDNLRQFAIDAGVPPAQAFTIPNGVDTTIFFPRGRRRTSGRRLIVSAGELIEAKGHHLVIEALRRLIDGGHDAELVIAGKAARGGQCYEAPLHRLVSRLDLQDRVRFAGWVDRNDLAELFSQAHLFCLASYTEGWPNVVHEALSCGSPVIVTDVGGVRALVNQDCGSIVPVCDIDALHRALEEGLTTRWDYDAIARWGESRNWRQVAAEVAAVFQSILDPQQVYGAKPTLSTGEMDRVRD